MEDIVSRLKTFIENEMRSCSMDIGGITPEYVYRKWGGTVALEEIEEAMEELRSHRNHRKNLNVDELVSDACRLR